MGDPNLLMTPAAPLDPITLAVVKSALDAIVDEMAYTVIRTARSEIVKDVMDYSAALCDAGGRMVAQAKTIAQHLGAVPDAMATVLRLFHDDLHPGDALIMNDPYEGGMPAKFFHLLRAGETIRHEQAGGGGFGDPLARDPELVAADARNEKITLEYARREHGVVLDPVTLKVDADATRRLREVRS